MKTINILLSLAVMGILTLGFADATDTNAEIVQKVQAIKNAPDLERSAMMNKLKADMQTMTPKQKNATIQEMQTVMHVDMSSVQTDSSMQENQMREHAQNIHMNEHQIVHEYADKVYEEGETFFDVNH